MGFFEAIWNFIRMIKPTDVIDVAIVAFAIYKIIGFVRETRVSQLLKGILLLLVVMQLSSIFKLNAVNYILRNTMQFGFLALIVVFQPELRRALEQMGTSKIGKNIPFFGNHIQSDPEATEQTIDCVCKAASKMSMQHVGMLIVFERVTILEEIIKTGTRLNATPSQELFLNIFYPKAPMHDGAVVIRENRVMAAGCFLPLSQQRGINKELGTRHRAALGVSETSDAVVVVVSEENGMISFAKNGILSRNITIDKLSAMLKDYLIPTEEKNEKGKKTFQDMFNRKGKDKK